MATGIIENAASQQATISLNEGMVNFSPDIAKSRDREIDKSVKDVAAREMEMSQLLDKSRTNRFAAEVFKPFFSKLAEVGIKIGEQNKPEELLKEILDGDGSYEDKVEIKQKSPALAEVKRLKQSKEREQSFNRNGSGYREALALLKEYSAAYSHYLTTQSSASLERLKEIREQLKKLGLTEAMIAKLEGRVKADPAEAVKDAIILEAFSVGVIEKNIRKRGLADQLNRLAADAVPEIVGRAKAQAVSELQSFVLEELETVLVRKTHSQDKDYSEVIKLTNLAEKTGLDFNKWLSEVWPQKKENHGLYLMDVPHSATGMNVDTSTDNPSNRAPRHGYEYEKKDENEVLVNRLRALYMQRALKGDRLTHLKTEFKIRKLKNGLFKLGIFTKDLDEQVKHEAEVVAKLKLIDMLKEALVERASFYELSGPAHELVERKLKGLLKNAERLGLPISSEEFISMRDSANLRVYDLSRREIEEVQAKRQANNNPKLEKKEKLLSRLLTRLSEESKIEASYASLS